MNFQAPIGVTKFQARDGSIYFPAADGTFSITASNDIQDAILAGYTPSVVGSVMRSCTAPYFGEILPDFNFTLDQGGSNQLINGWNNSPGNFSVNISGSATLKVPACAKGIIMNVESFISATGVNGTFLRQDLTVYSDAAWTKPTDFFIHHAREFGFTAAQEFSGLMFKLFMPIVGGKIYYNVAVTGQAAANFDYFVAGFWF